MGRFIFTGAFPTGFAFFTGNSGRNLILVVGKDYRSMWQVVSPIIIVFFTRSRFEVRQAIFIYFRNLIITPLFSVYRIRSLSVFGLLCIAF